MDFKRLLSALGGRRKVRSAPKRWDGVMAPGFDPAGAQPAPHESEGLHENWGAAVKNDFVLTFAGGLIGTGTAREVYEMVGQPGLVIKVETTAGTFQNIAEWKLWNEVQFTPWAHWFAPCRRISPCGLVLIQERTVPLDDGELPEALPDFFTDIKPDNFGRIGGRVVAQDYALTLLSGVGLQNAALRTVAPEEWEPEEEE